MASNRSDLDTLVFQSLTVQNREIHGELCYFNPEATFTIIGLWFTDEEKMHVKVYNIFDARREEIAKNTVLVNFSS